LSEYLKHHAPVNVIACKSSSNLLDLPEVAEEFLEVVGVCGISSLDLERSSGQGQWSRELFCPLLIGRMSVNVTNVDQISKSNKTYHSKGQAD
jgi:hypothetical protein